MPDEAAARTGDLPANGDQEATALGLFLCKIQFQQLVPRAEAQPGACGVACLSHLPSGSFYHIITDTVVFVRNEDGSNRRVGLVAIAQSGCQYCGWRIVAVRGDAASAGALTENPDLRVPR
jgi:hypothetical protein